MLVDLAWRSIAANTLPGDRCLRCSVNHVVDVVSAGLTQRRAPRTAGREPVAAPAGPGTRPQNGDGVPRAILLLSPVGSRMSPKSPVQPAKGRLSAPPPQR